MSALKIGSLFSGIGGLDLAVEEFFDAETAWHCEWEAEPSKVLAARWPGVPNLHDVTKVDWSAVEPVDIMCGGFPCQDVSLAGRRRGMKEGTRSGLWAEFARAIDIVRPSVVVIENVRGLLSAEAGGDVEPCPWCMGDGADEYHLRALDAVLADLSDLGFDAEWTGLRAADVGAPHGRFRFFLLAYARGVRLDAWRDAAPGEAAGGRTSALARGRADAPLTLLPTPVAQPSGNTPEEHLRKKPGREVVTDLAILVENDLLESGGRLLPTPTARLGDGSGRGASHPDRRKALNSKRGGELDEIAVHIIPDGINWGAYEPAVRRWESLTRPAPTPTLPDGKNGNHRLSAAFCEWMMGYPAGWVTDVIGRNSAIKACGNGVVPQQAFAALSVLWPQVGQEVAA